VEDTEVTDLRMAIISATGTARKRLIPAVRARKLCSIVAVHGRDSGKLAALASKNSILQFFLDAEKMLDETKPDFVFIGSPPALHREQIQMCIERDIPVLCEKPLCLTPVEAQALRSPMTSRQTPLRIAHHLRHQRRIVFARDLMIRRSYGLLGRNYQRRTRPTSTCTKFEVS
jgi:predicted dehydrogenase